ncbi:hypothetical protein EDD16DRAFT_167411 [Pisolithus croceorrhizus]|nr:hypothetical protein EDD16DRAFT_167411 [Pisolithus croceorrhizus]
MFSVSLFVLALPVVRTNVMDSSVDTALHILCREEDENAFMIVAVLAIACNLVNDSSRPHDVNVADDLACLFHSCLLIADWRLADNQQVMSEGGLMQSFGTENRADNV